MKKSKKEYYSVISSVIHISESEVALVLSDYERNWTEWDESFRERLSGTLFDLGLDTKQPYEFQDTIQHRNRLDKVVMCGRFFGSERSDIDWLQSGYASTAAKDKARNSRLVDDLYRSKALTIDTQMALEARDKYNKIEDESDNGDE